MKRWYRSGSPWVWLNAAALTFSVLLVMALLLVISWQGISHFWPAPIVQFDGQQNGHLSQVLGQIRRSEPIREADAGMHEPGVTTTTRYLLQQNRQQSGSPFAWYGQAQMHKLQYPAQAVRLVTLHGETMYGFIHSVSQNGSVLAAGELEVNTLLQPPLRQGSVRLLTGDDKEIEILLADIDDISQPNAMSFWQKTTVFWRGIGHFLSAGPQAANTRGGIFPAIVGTALMVLLMSVLVTPLGVLAAIYLHEYAGQHGLVRLVRLSVYNLAGVPSIIFGVFGLGFFVYVLGGGIDRLFFADELPTPTLGTPGLLWVSLTLALLTLPVVIVSTEEGLARIPVAMRMGSLALGATRSETIWRVVVPQAIPAMLTGLILAIARAAGEVAPLMLVGVVKLAPALPVSSEFPFVHLDQKIMHLGFHIYDAALQSPDTETTLPLVYATALVLIVLILALNISAIVLRNRLREKYRSETE